MPPITPRHSRSAATRVTPGTYSHATLACHTVRWTASVGLRSEPGVLGAHRSRASSLSIREARHWRGTTANGKAQLRESGGKGSDRCRPMESGCGTLCANPGAGKAGAGSCCQEWREKSAGTRRFPTTGGRRRSAPEKNLEKTLDGNTKGSVTSYEKKHWRAGPALYVSRPTDLIGGTLVSGKRHWRCEVSKRPLRTRKSGQEPSNGQTPRHLALIFFPVFFLTPSFIFLLLFLANHETRRRPFASPPRDSSRRTTPGRAHSSSGGVI
ncbi:hypothetical protein MRX96_009727 [Rhipicephalus microplus]